MNLSYVQKLLIAADPFSAIRTNFRGWKTTRRKRLRGRHLTCVQRENIASGLQDSGTGPVSMSASASDTEAVGYEDEIANVLEETGFEVEIDNAKRKPYAHNVHTGLEMTVSDETVRTVPSSWTLPAITNAGVAIVTRINAKRRSNNTLYITVGPNGAPALVAPATQRAAKWQAMVLRSLPKKWKAKFASGLRRPEQGD
jgi:hypothetical protein